MMVIILESSAVMTIINGAYSCAISGIRIVTKPRTIRIVPRNCNEKTRL